MILQSEAFTFAEIPKLSGMWTNFVSRVDKLVANQLFNLGIAKNGSIKKS